MRKIRRGRRKPRRAEVNPAAGIFLPRLVFPFLLFLCFRAFSFAVDFDGIFPGLEPDIREKVFSAGGYYHLAGTDRRQAGDKDGRGISVRPPEYAAAGAAEIISLNPDYIIESLMVLPVKGASLLDIYNALGRTRDLQGREYHSHTREKYVPLFEKVTRVKNKDSRTAIPDPDFPAALPQSEDIYFLVKDINFGSCCYKSEFRAGAGAGVPGGAYIDYRISNVKTVSFYIIPVIRERKMNIYFHIEPVDEGLALYSLGGITMEPVVSHYVDVPSAVKKRFDVIQGWIIDGLKGVSEKSGRPAL